LKGEKNYYKILGVHEKASNHELRKAFCKLTKELHPDTTSLNLDDAKIKLQTVLEAYENLNNPYLRHLYDSKLNKVLISDKQLSNQSTNSYTSDSKIANSIGDRRPLSNGEIFSLFLLGLVIFVSLIFAILFANFTGKEMNSLPIWLLK
tara:strand:- start:17465 stop:17911 length:447 start_codon:yes stop_codon:yes gene_type:complete